MMLNIGCDLARINSGGVWWGGILGYRHAIMCVQSKLGSYVFVLLLECAAWLKCVSINDTVADALIDERTWN